MFSRSSIPISYSAPDSIRRDEKRLVVSNENVEAKFAMSSSIEIAEVLIPF